MKVTLQPIRLRDKLKALYLRYHNAYSHQTLLCGDM